MKPRSEEAQALINKIEADFQRRKEALNKPFELTEFVATPSSSYDPLDEPSEEPGCFSSALRFVALFIGLFTLLGITEASGSARAILRHAWLIGCDVFSFLCWCWCIAAILLVVWVVFCYCCRGVNRWQDRIDEDRQALLN